jgi:hypothetical protein
VSAGNHYVQFLSFWGASLSGADLQDANLRQAYLQATTLNGADLTSPPFLSAPSVRLRGLGILRIVTKVLVGVTEASRRTRCPV